jgi:GNAT superfamily N-acetyltransferase
MRRRIEDIARLPDHAVFIACQGASVVAWIHVSVVQHLQDDRKAEIGGLVVTANARSAGIGRELVRRAEQWAQERGLKSVVVRSRIAREAAHRFYLREGYVRTKTSAVFTKELGPVRDPTAPMI